MLDDTEIKLRGTKSYSSYTLSAIHVCLDLTIVDEADIMIDTNTNDVANDIEDSRDLSERIGDKVSQ